MILPDMKQIAGVLLHIYYTENSTTKTIEKMSVELQGLFDKGYWLGKREGFADGFESCYRRVNESNTILNEIARLGGQDD